MKQPSPLSEHLAGFALRLRSGACCVQMMTILPILLGRFEVQLAEGMGDWEACWQRQTCAFILRLSGGIWMHFKPRAAA